VAAIQPAMMVALKRVLQDRFVSRLPVLAGTQSEEDKRKKQLSRAFSAFAIQKVCDASASDSAAAVIDDFNDNGIDAIYYDQKQSTLFLVQSKLKATEQFSQEEAQAFAQGVRLLLNNDFGAFNELFHNILPDIENALDHCENIELLVAYTGAGISLHAKQALNQVIEEQQENEERLCADVVYLDGGCIEVYLRDEQAVKPVNTRIRLEKHNKVEEPRITYYGLVKVNDLIELHRSHGKALYQKNIRYFIGAGKHGVNQAIKNTLLNKPENFVYLNNGVTAVCNKIEPKRSKGGYKDFKVLGLSIINGAQTVASAEEFASQHPEADIKTARVMLTMIKASDSGDFHQQVTKARNLQNPVDLGNFAALDDKQEKLRQELGLHGIDYRYRPELNATNSASVLEIDELIKALACLSENVRFPALLKSEPKLFTYSGNNEYQDIFNQQLTAFIAINAVRVFREVSHLLKGYERSSYSPEKLVYRHAVYVVAFVLMKQMKGKIFGTALLTEDEIKKLISEPMDTIRQGCFDVYEAGYYGMAHAEFKRIGTTASLVNKLMIYIFDKAEDNNVKGMLAKLAENDKHNQRLTRYLAHNATQI